MQCMEVWGGNQAADSGVIMPGLDAWVACRPYRDESAGGDLHYVSSCATGRITRVLVADVSGHGTAVAGIAVKLRTLMRRYVNYIDQSRFVRGLNAEFTTLADAGCFATAVAVTYWAPTRYVVICNAGHPRPLRYDGRARAWQALDPRDRGAENAELTNLPLGITDAAGYDQFSLRLQRDDLLLLYTDSLVEARDPSGALLGERGLLQVLSRLDPREPRTLVPALIDAIRAHGGGELPEDDVTVMLLRPNTLAQRRSIREWVATVGRYARALLRSIRRRDEPFPWPEPTLANIGGALADRLNRRVGTGPEGPVRAPDGRS